MLLILNRLGRFEASIANMLADGCLELPCTTHFIQDVESPNASAG
jgi:hypothetical protein